MRVQYGWGDIGEKPVLDPAPGLPVVVLSLTGLPAFLERLVKVGRSCPRSESHGSIRRLEPWADLSKPASTVFYLGDSLVLRRGDPRQRISATAFGLDAPDAGHMSTASSSPQDQCEHRL